MFCQIKKKFFIILWLCVALFSVFQLKVPVCFAAELFKPAFKTIGVWNKSRSVRIDVNVWYPTHSKPSRAQYGEWSFDVVRFGRAAAGRFPLIVLSHDSAATRFSYYDTAAFLARCGFVVMAPDHKNDNLQRMSQLFTWQQLSERMRDVQIILDMAEKHKDVREMIDTSRMGFLGFGTGASIALLLGGARIDASGFDGYCRRVPQSIVYCNAWAARHVQKMLQGLPTLGQSFSENRFKAIVAVGPKYDMFFTPKALQTLRTGVMLIEGETDLKKKAWAVDGVQAFFPEYITHNIFKNIEARDLMAPCPAQLKKDLPDLCGTASADVRKLVYDEFSKGVSTFFLNILGKLS